MNSDRLISPEAMENSRWVTLPRPQTCPETGTLYGGSVNAIAAIFPSIRRAQFPVSRLEPQRGDVRPGAKGSGAADWFVFRCDLLVGRIRRTCFAVIAIEEQIDLAGLPAENLDRTLV